MKALTKDFFKTLIIAGLALVFAITLSVVNADWTSAPANPPANNAPAPINVGSIDQVKNGGLALNSLLVTGGLRITSGTPGAGKVLTSDAQGNATWQGGGGTGAVGRMIALFDGACPAGWNPYYALEGRVPRGVSATSTTYGSVGGQGGEETHIHPRVGSGGGRTNAGYGAASSW
ncbi:hypothetical protein EPO17_00895, partial [Patescibacteria group bacterium]